MKQALKRLVPRDAPATREPVARSRRERDLELVARRAWLRSRTAEGEARA